MGDWAPRFIGALMEGMSITNAAHEAGVHITMPYKRRQHDEEFRRSWEEAAVIGTELLEQEAQRRAFHGTIKPVFQKGECVGHVREYSDALMMMLLKARRPEKYREGMDARQQSGEFNLTVNVVNVEAPKVEEEAREVLPIEVIDVADNRD